MPPPTMTNDVTVEPPLVPTMAGGGGHAAGVRAGVMPPPALTNDVTMEPPPVPTMATAVATVAAGMPRA